MKNQNVVTFGCRLNNFDSQIIKEKIKFEKLKNIFFINTCAVTKEAERQAKKKIRKIKRENPGAKIVVTGCSAQINPEIYKVGETQLNRFIKKDASDKIESGSSTYIPEDTSEDTQLNLALKIMNNLLSQI